MLCRCPTMNFSPVFYKYGFPNTWGMITGFVTLSGSLALARSLTDLVSKPGSPIISLGDPRDVTWNSGTKVSSYDKNRINETTPPHRLGREVNDAISKIHSAMLLTHPGYKKAYRYCHCDYSCSRYFLQPDKFGGFGGKGLLQQEDGLDIPAFRGGKGRFRTCEWSNSTDMYIFLNPWHGSPLGQCFSTDRFPNVTGKKKKKCIYCCWKKRKRKTSLKAWGHFRTNVIKSMSLLENESIWDVVWVG